MSGFSEPVNADKIRKEIELAALTEMMEEMANAPKEEFGKRQPGELATYEKPIRCPRVGEGLHEEL